MAITRRRIGRPVSDGAGLWQQNGTDDYGHSERLEVRDLRSV